MPPESSQDPPTPTSVRIYRRCPRLWRNLRCRRFPHLVAEAALDNIVYSAIRRESDPAAEPILNLEAWINGSLMPAARQEAFRTPKHRQCDFAVLIAVASREENSELVEEVWTALFTLPDLEGEAIYRTVMLGQSLAQAGKEMGCVASTVLRARKRGLKSLRVLLAHLDPAARSAAE